MSDWRESDEFRPTPTGAVFAKLKPGADPQDVVAAAASAGFAAATVATRSGVCALPPGSAVFPDFGVAILEPASRSGANGLSLIQTAEAMAAVEAARPEFYLHASDHRRPAPGPHSGTMSFSDWARLGAEVIRAELAREIAAGGAAAPEPARAPLDAVEADDDAAATWAMRAVGALDTDLTGAGVRVAVLDTGADLRHPLLKARIADHESFVPGETTDDGNGHGTHCCGLVAGGAGPGGVRIGVAPKAELYVGKVLSNGGSGRELQIIRGVQWAMENECDVISLSLGRRVWPGENPAAGYATVFEAAEEAGCMIVAAAGNDSWRPTYIAPVSSPANDPRALAVAAFDKAFAAASFSNGGMNADQPIGLAAPGVDILSSWPAPLNWKRIDGTSMATPIVAGLAALLKERRPELRGAALRAALIALAGSLGDKRDFGAGLVAAAAI